MQEIQRELCVIDWCWQWTKLHSKEKGYSIELLVPQSLREVDGIHGGILEEHTMRDCALSKAKNRQRHKKGVFAVPLD